MVISIRFKNINTNHTDIMVTKLYQKFVHKTFLLLLVTGLAAVNTACFTTQYLQPRTIENQAVSTKTYDEVWDEAIDYVANAGFSISTLEKASGLIVCQNVGVSSNSVTYESNGVLRNPNAYIVTTKQCDEYRTSVDFNIRVKNVDGGTSITVNLMNINVMYFDIWWTGQWQPLAAQSTGVFERNLLNHLK